MAAHSRGPAARPGADRRDALVRVDGKRFLAIEAEPGAKPDAARLRSRLAWAQLDRVVQIRSIPVDRRHNAKVDYTALRRAV